MTLRDLANDIKELRREYNARWGSKPEWPDYARARYEDMCEQIKELREAA